MKTVALLLLFAGLAAAQPDAGRGRQQYVKSCSFCHGVSADGGAEGPSLIRSASLRHDRNGDLIGPVIHDGRPEKGMPPIPLTPAQSADVVAFLHAQLKKLDKTSPGKPARDRFPLEVLLTGDAAAGKRYFQGAGGCAACHSPTGDLAGIAKKLPPVDLQTRFLYPVGKPAMATVTPSGAPSIQGSLVIMDAFFVTIRDADGWQHTWPLKSVQVEVLDPLAAHRALLKTITNADIHNLFAYLVTL